MGGGWLGVIIFNHLADKWTHSIYVSDSLGIQVRLSQVICKFIEVYSALLPILV